MADYTTDELASLSDIAPDDGPADAVPLQSLADVGSPTITTYHMGGLTALDASLAWTETGSPGTTNAPGTLAANTEFISASAQS